MSSQNPSRRVKILRLVGRLNLGGPIRQIQPLCCQLDSKKFETSLAFGEVGKDEKEEVEPFLQCGIWMERLSQLRRPLNPFRDLRAFFQTLRTIRRERPQILHTHLAKAGALGRLAGGLCRVPARVHTYHGTNFRGHFGPLASRLSRWGEKFLCLFCDVVVAVSEADKEELVRSRVVAEKKITVILPGINLQPYLQIETQSGLLRKKLGLNREDLLIGFVGRLVPVKNPQDFLAMAASVSIAFPKTRFVILGDGPLRDSLRREIESLGMKETVRFLGWEQDMVGALSDLDLVVSCSKSEGMSISLIEAMAAARAVVARGVGGIPELIQNGKTGVLVSPESIHGLEEAVCQLIEDKESRGELGKNARESVRERFTAERLVRDHERLYQNLSKPALNS